MPNELYRIAEEDGVNVVELFLGDALDSMEFDRLNEALLGAVDKQPAGRWVLDLTHTVYMGSAVLGLLVNLRQRIKQRQGRLVLAGLTPQLEQIFRACCMERLFTMTKTRPEALRSLAR
jgi:anti-sigma B factor antagonist